MPLILVRDDYAKGNADVVTLPAGGEPLERFLQESLETAWREGRSSVAFSMDPEAARSRFGEDALPAARRVITDFLADHDMDVRLVIDSRRQVLTERRRSIDLVNYIRRHLFRGAGAFAPEEHEKLFAGAPAPKECVESSTKASVRRKTRKGGGRKTDEKAFSGGQKKTDRQEALEEQILAKKRDESAGPLEDASIYEGAFPGSAPVRHEEKPLYSLANSAPATGSLDDRIGELEGEDRETFHQMLFRLIGESGMTNAQVYTRANMSKKLFSKIKLNPDSIPKKKNVIALAIALELDMEETEELLMKAGYALSDSTLSDVIISYFIERGIYNVFDINEALFDHGQENSLLGF